MTPADLGETARAVERELKTLDDRIAGRKWLVGGKPSAADIAIYPFLATLRRATTKAEARAREVGLFPIGEVCSAIHRWMALVEGLPAYDRTYPPHWRSAQ